MKKKYIIVIIVMLAVLIDLSVLLYPTVSETVNARSQSRVVAKYIDTVTGANSAKTQAMLDAADAYNKALLHNPSRYDFTAADTAEYKGQINTSGGVMGILMIDKINVRLPIYHGTDEGVLEVGVGHVEGTSLPVGGIGTHTVIAGHTGLPSALLLTDLNKLTNGDTFVLYILGQALTYQVDQIQVVLPEEADQMDIDPDMDYCTLVTCTPYGVNDHRLLVRGHRIETSGKGWTAISAGASQLDKVKTILIFNMPVCLILTVYAVLKSRKIHKGGLIQ